MIDGMDDEEMERLNKRYLSQTTTVTNIGTRKAQSETNLLEPTSTDLVIREGIFVHPSFSVTHSRVFCFIGLVLS